MPTTVKNLVPPVTPRTRGIGGACLIVMGCAFALQAHAQTATLLDSIVVVASRAQPGPAGRTVDVITREAIAHSPARTLAELLGTRLSIDSYTRSPAQADVTIRGATAEQVLILVDGVRMGDAQSAHYALDLGVPLADIERIEILRGTGSALYGANAVGGVINIVTLSARAARRVEASSVEWSARAGSFGTLGLGGSGTTRIGETSLVGALQLDRAEGHRAGTDYRILQSRIGTTRPLGGGVLVADASLGVRDFGASDFYSPYNSSERTGTTVTGARWGGALGAWAVTAGAHTRLHTDRFTLVRDNPAIYENRHRSWQSGVAVSARTTVTNAAKLAVGAEAEHDQLSSARLGGRRDWHGAVYGEVAGNINRHVQVIAGARGDHAAQYGDFLSPSMAVAIASPNDVIIRASGSRGFRAPTWTERFYTDPRNIGSPTLGPERFWNGELGGQYSPEAARSVDLTIDVAGFVRRADNLIDWVRPVANASAPWNAANVGTGTFRGIEGMLSALLAERVRLALGGSGLAFSDGAAVELVGKYALRPITRQATGSVSLPLTGSMDVTVDVVHARRAREQAYTTMNTRVRWLFARARLLLDASNLANASWLDATGHVAQGRALFVGVEW